MSWVFMQVLITVFTRLYLVMVNYSFFIRYWYSGIFERSSLSILLLMYLNLPFNDGFIVL